jgi:hypothetical protein
MPPWETMMLRIKQAKTSKPYEDYHSFQSPGDEVNYSFTYMNVRFIGYIQVVHRQQKEWDR